jgi:hypothetical protein
MLVKATNLGSVSLFLLMISISLLWAVKNPHFFVREIRVFTYLHRFFESKAVFWSRLVQLLFFWSVVFYNGEAPAMVSRYGVKQLGSRIAIVAGEAPTMVNSTKTMIFLFTSSVNKITWDPNLLVKTHHLNRCSNKTDVKWWIQWCLKLWKTLKNHLNLNWPSWWLNPVSSSDGQISLDFLFWLF